MNSTQKKTIYDIALSSESIFGSDGTERHFTHTTLTQVALCVNPLSSLNLLSADNPYSDLLLLVPFDVTAFLDDILMKRRALDNS